MNNVRKHTHILAWCLLALFASCSQDELQTDCNPTVVHYDDGCDMAVRIGYNLFERPTENGLSTNRDASLQTRASIIGGDEDANNYINQLWMLCFTKEGIYLGYRMATLTGNEQLLPDVLTTNSPNDQTTDNGCRGRYLFEGSVPSRTSRIHFIANIPEDRVPGNDLIGGQENGIIKSARLRVTTSDRNITYWGFHGEESPELLKAWLAVTTWRDSINSQGQPVTDESGNVIQVVDQYLKKDGSVVHLIRDRARLRFGDMFDYTRTTTETVTNIHGNTEELDVNNTTYSIEAIDWIQSNVLEQGYIAPFCAASGKDAFDDYYDPSSNPQLKEDRLTPYDRPDKSRATADDESEMVAAWRASWSDAERKANSQPLYLFEDENTIQDPVRIILRVEYQDRVKGHKVKYFPIMLLKGDNQPCLIYRNHQYTLSLYSLPWEGVGYTTFAEAVASTEYINNRTVTIDERVSNVSDGKYNLTIEGSTNRIHQDPAQAGTVQHIVFRYTLANDRFHGVEGITRENFTVRWRKTPFASFALPDVTVDSYDVATGVGVISYTLGNTINTALGSGTIQLHDENSGLSRFINVYSISQFSFLPEGEAALSITKVTDNGRTIHGVVCPTYRMDIRLPGDYPVGLYPLTIRMATTTLNPFSISDNGASPQSVTFGVDMASTNNGSTIDGETLTGMATSSNHTSWMYNSISWNYWYTFILTDKPTTTVDGAETTDEDDHTYTIYFDDIRSLRAPANRADKVGLFLKIRYFGDAVGVESVE